MLRTAFSAVLLGMLLAPLNAMAHALAPSLLSLEPVGGGVYEVTWKTPLQRVDGGRLRPIAPVGCETVVEPAVAHVDTALVQRWRMDCGINGLAGRTLAVEGIAASQTDVLLRIGRPPGPALQHVLTAASPRFTVPEVQSRTDAFGQYLVLGIQHLLTGLDHMLFVAALLMLIGLRRGLVWTITSFTLGHSVTLSAAVFGYVHFPQALAEILIALTVLITLAAVLKRSNGSLLQRRPALIAFGFGLLHGLGFAGALQAIGLPPADIPLALLAFNAGIEVGQLVLIGGLLALMLLIRRRRVVALGKLVPLPVYCAGTLSAFWFWQRVLGG